MNAIAAGLIFDVVTLVCLTAALRSGVDWRYVGPLMAAVIAARLKSAADARAAAALPPAPPASGLDRPTPPPAPPSSKGGLFIARVILASGAFALLAAIPSMLSTKIGRGAG